jgi:hypothetical protein
VQVGTSRDSSVSGGADYPFTLAQLGEYLLRPITPLPARIHLRGELDDLDQSRSGSMAAGRHDPADGCDRSKSARLADRSGYCWKCGITRPRRSSSRRVSHFSVLSLRSGRMLPHPNSLAMRRRTSARSPFWLTDRLGLTSQPVASLARGEIETVKQPSSVNVPGDVCRKELATVPGAGV